jgi:predicted enzyme related to lactoylglutathione lyase
MGALVIFARDVSRLAAFYESVLSLNPFEDSWGGIRLLDDKEEILIHPIPKAIAKTIDIQTPPRARENTAIKPVFNVVSLSACLEEVQRRGGVVTDQTFSLDGLTRHDVLDPEGNVVQLRSREI